MINLHWNPYQWQEGHSIFLAEPILKATWKGTLLGNKEPSMNITDVEIFADVDLFEGFVPKNEPQHDIHFKCQMTV